MRASMGAMKMGRRYQLQQQREFWPLVLAAGTGIVVHYAFRAYMNLNEDDRETKPLENSIVEQCSFGIDMGSSFSKIAMHRNDKPQPFVVENREGKRSIPSEILFPNGINTTDNSVTDVDHDSYVVGSSASSSRFLKPENTYNPSSSSVGEIEKSFIYYLLAKELKSSAQSKSDRAGMLPSFVSVPNYFSVVQSSLVVSACRDAGFNCIGALPDAVSAVLGNIETGIYLPSYMKESMKHETVIVIDVGGNIVQISALLVKNLRDSTPIVLSQKILLENGGRHFDKAIVDYLIREFEKQNKGVVIASDKMARQRLYDAAEAAKIELSTASSSKVLIPFITADQYGPKHLDCDISRATLSALIDSLLTDISSSVETVLHSAKQQLLLTRKSDGEKESGEKIDMNLAAFMIVGGGARMSLVKAGIERIAGEVPVLTGQQPEEIVSIGAAAFARIISK
jgi:molecular chaperone DnaK